MPLAVRAAGPLPGRFTGLRPDRRCPAGAAFGIGGPAGQTVGERAASLSLNPLGPAHPPSQMERIAPCGDHVHGCCCPQPPWPWGCSPRPWRRRPAAISPRRTPTSCSRRRRCSLPGTRSNSKRASRCSRSSRATPWISAWSSPRPASPSCTRCRATSSRAWPSTPSSRNASSRSRSCCRLCRP